MKIYEHQWRKNSTIYIDVGVGFCKVNIYREIDRTVAELYDFIIYPEFRGAGAGRKLMDVALQNAAERGADILVLWPDCEPWVEEWYHRKGFEYDDNVRNNAGEPALVKKLK